jgi:hypothetical protein
MRNSPSLSAAPRVSLLAATLCSLLTALGFAGDLSGHIRDAASGEALPSVVIALEGTDLGAVTNNDGYYLVGDIPPGAYQVSFTALGYEARQKDIMVIGDTNIVLSLSLVSSPISLSEVKVTAQRAEFKREVKVSSLTLSHGELRNTPFVLESDLFRSLQTLPGVVSTSDFSSAMFVRGGNADQNLILLDGVSVYNPTHLGGIFSVFDPDILKSAELLAGGFPAEYGGRLSSVLDVQTRDGNAKRFAGNMGTSLLASKAVFEGPLPTGSFFLSGRRTYFDKLLGVVGYDFPYYFYDVSAKAVANPGPNTRLAATGFLSDDKFNLGTGNEGVLLEWGNKLGSVMWQQYWSSRFSTRTFLTANYYFYDIVLGGGIVSVKDWIREFGLRSKATWVLSGENEIEAGIEADYGRFRYDANLLGGYKFDITGDPLPMAAYAQAKLKPFSNLLIEPGARLDFYSLSQHLDTSRFNVSPRVSFKYFLNDITAIKGAVGRYHQYVSALYPDFSPLPFLFFWVPLFASYLPQQGDHYILGYEHWLDENTNFTVEGYYKHYSTIHELAANPNPDSLTETLLRTGRGYSWGADVMLKRDWGKLTGWLSYSLCFAKVTFDSLQYPPSYDRRHIFNIVASYALPKGFGLTAHWNYGTGLPYTSTIGYFRRWDYGYRRDRIRPDWVEIPSGKNAARYPDYHRLDLGVEKTFRVGKTKLVAQLEVINVYNQKNLMLYYWDYGQTPPLRKQQNQLPLLPSLGVKWSF